ncbi:MAG: hypothetical protein COU98_01465 [Candidatus Staskawiczbacteria bacterium CG10_big_fil_rev_8_21_14_0_10_38_10]|uniref:Radical SAM core domain-containing protein n=1 Tax=Candidatus Staskawiczbacteria bacterium CG10_big_fil_rev_8_21_14_0_10_38_10 TaxID=1974891 RepID=A0A2H9T1C5_9BACT|nr:MAG: hypothetical protein COU98_01465 [Candidatus Staskawiczbacteria bacterium CG10_big_fil_rev_8_21_14_0_10_38_10]
MKDEYVFLRSNWTIRGSPEKCVLFDFRGGIFEERFVLSNRAYKVLRLAGGQHTCAQMKRIIGFDPTPYVRYLMKLGVVELSDSPRETPRQFKNPYKGKNFLGRIMLHITGRCNQNCKHCYLASRKWDELSFAEIAELVRQAADMNVASFSITGGEPFVREDLVDILQELNRNEMKVEGLFTNGTILPNGFLDKARGIQDFPFFVSINGPSTEGHDQFGGEGAVFEKTLETIKRLTEQGIKVFANTSLNVFFTDEQQIERLYKLIKELRIYRWRISGPFLEGNWKANFQQFGISTETELQIMLKLLEIWLEDGRPFELELGHVFRYIDGRCIQRVYKKGDYVCDYFRDRIVIMPNGEVSACSLLITPPYIIGNIREQSLREIWESKKMRYYKNLRIADVMNDKCRLCAKLSECGIGCRANAVLTSGRYEDIDPEICGICTHPLSARFTEILQNSGIPIVRE